LDGGKEQKTTEVEEKLWKPVKQSSNLQSSSVGVCSPS